MPRAELELVGGEYATVAERIEAFYARFPEGRIITELMTRTEVEVTFRARVYRRLEDSRPSATGWASEREGDGMVNEFACLENTETSAIGRALANLGFASSIRRPSVEEMSRVSRARERRARAASDSVPVASASADRASGVGTAAARPSAVGAASAARPYARPPVGSAAGVARSSATAAPASRGAARGAGRDAAGRQRAADTLTDVYRLLREAERSGMRPGRVAALRRGLQTGGAADERRLRDLEAALRDYLARRIAERVGDALGEGSPRLSVVSGRQGAGP